MPRSYVARLVFESESSEVDYLEACARIRGIRVSALLQRLVDTIAAEQMVLTVLDDEDRYQTRRKGEWRTRA